MGKRSVWLGVGCALALVVGGCASGDGGPNADASGMDAGPPTDGGGNAGPDSGVRGDGLTCETCETSTDCAVDHYCAPLAAGGSVCLARCDIDLPDCAPRFECVMNFSASIPFPVCAPVGERCCVDFDEDLHGTGVGCLGTDCNDDDATVSSSGSETCDGQDNDCNGTVDDGNQDVLCPRGEHVADSMCGGGICEIAGCEPGFADCNRTAADGCEVSTTGSTDCGMCGTPCTIANGTPDCSGGACRVGACDPGFGDCNGMAADGCEEPLTSVGHCGACGNTCSLTRASESCASGTCEIVMCDPGYGDCDLNDASGCEASTRTNADCGSCGTVCSPTNATGDCSTGSCRVSGCNPGYGDCNFDSLSCETRLNTTTNCGACGSVCNLANATESCTTGTCTFGACSTNFSNCDSNTANGCEVGHRTYDGTCGSNSMGDFDADEACGFICGGNPLDTTSFATTTGETSGWYWARMIEDSDCDAHFNHEVRLTVPAGADYDLFLYTTCGGSPVSSSTSRTLGADEVVSIRIDDPFNGGTERIPYYIEVRHVSGATCSDWTLRFYGRDC